MGKEKKLNSVLSGEITKMTKDKVAKYAGSWKQVKADNMDAVLEATGMGWTSRKAAGLMNVDLDIEARDNGMFTSFKTTLKSAENVLLFEGITKTKGFADEDVDITTSFDENDDFNMLSIMHHKSGDVESKRKYEIKNGQLILTQCCNGKTGIRTFDKK